MVRSAGTRLTYAAGIGQKLTGCIMARQEHEREDLLREATALRRRVQLLTPLSDEPIVIGFRQEGAASVYVGAEPVYQFNGQGELRRGFEQGCMVKAEDRQLVILQKTRLQGQLQLVRRPLTADEQQQYLQRMHDLLGDLRQVLRGQQFQLQGQIPEGEDVLADIRTWLESMPHRVAIAGRPNVSR